MAAMAVDGPLSPSPPPPASKLYNSSFSSHRLTPLYNFRFSRLKSYARDFRDIVRGDSIRGVQVTSVGPTDRAKPVVLRSCEWTVDNDLLPGQSFESVVISIEWEDGSTFTAALVPNFTSSDTILGKRKRGTGNEDEGDFTVFPLLLVRGAQVVVQHLIDYLTTHFDSRSSIMSIPSEMLSECLQDYLSIIFQEEDTQRTLGRKLKILEIIFSIPEVKDSKVKGALRKLTLSIGASDVKDLYERYDTMYYLSTD